uniref:Uncharacterized protein n=1 Tax=Setaria italica TaxID=4555 RepID=K4A4H2_SETIT
MLDAADPGKFSWLHTCTAAPITILASEYNFIHVC